MAAVQQHGGSLWFASEEMKAKVNAVVIEFECDAGVAARALMQSRVLQLAAKCLSDDGSGEPRIDVTCTNPGGNVVANLSLKPDSNAPDLWQRISENLAVPPPVRFRGDEEQRACRHGCSPTAWLQPPVRFRGDEEQRACRHGCGPTRWLEPLVRF